MSNLKLFWVPALGITIIFLFVFPSVVSAFPIPDTAQDTCNQADSNIDLADVILAFQVALGEYPSDNYDDFLLSVGDISGDGRIGLDEAIYIMQVVAGMRQALSSFSLALMVATDTDKLELAWTPACDGETPADDIQYAIHLSTRAHFIPVAATLKMTVTGTHQAGVSGLVPATTYYGVVIAIYGNSSRSAASNKLQATTYKNPVVLDPATIVSHADDLGLGKFSSTDGSTLVFSNASGNLPDVDSVLFAEDTEGRMTLRRVESADSANGVVTIVTSAAALTDVFDSASLSSSFQLFDIGPQSASPAKANSHVTAGRISTQNGSSYSRIDWKDRLLKAEQNNWTYDEKELIVETRGKTSTFKLIAPNALSESFTATVTTSFEPEIITEAEWGGTVVETLDSAKIAAKGILTLEAIAAYNFSASGSVTKNFELFDKTWTSIYPVDATGIFVHQEITLSMNVEATASAAAEINAHASASLSEAVEAGAIYNGSTWEPYIVTNEEKALTASLDIVGEAFAEIRLIPEVNVTFYKVSSASLTIEPFVGSSLTFSETTNNTDFLLAHPERLIQVTAFDAFLGMESHLSVNLSALDINWDILPPTCVLGTGDCLIPFDRLDLFSIPNLALDNTNSSSVEAELRLQVTDGAFNRFNAGSVQWEVFPTDADIQPGACSKVDNVTTCYATFTPPNSAPQEQEYTIFASGHGILGVIARQFKDITLTYACGLPWASETVMWEGREWQRCDDNQTYTWDQAQTYCEVLDLGGHSDWRLPTKDELKSLVVCTNGTPTPLQDPPGQPNTCGAWNEYVFPTIDPSFIDCKNWGYWSSTPSSNPLNPWHVWFEHGRANYNTTPSTPLYVRCVR